MVVDEDNQYSERAEQSADDSAFVFLEETKVELLEVA